MASRGKLKEETVFDKVGYREPLPWERKVQRLRLNSKTKRGSGKRTHHNQNRENFGGRERFDGQGGVRNLATKEEGRIPL